MQELPIRTMQAIVENNPAPVFQKMEGMGIVPLNRQMTFENWYNTLAQYNQLSAQEAIPILVNTLEVATNPINKHGQDLLQLAQKHGMSVAQLVEQQLWDIVNGTLPPPTTSVTGTEEMETRIKASGWAAPLVLFFLLLGFGTFVALVFKSVQKILR